MIIREKFVNNITGNIALPNLSVVINKLRATFTKDYCTYQPFGNIPKYLGKLRKSFWLGISTYDLRQKMSFMIFEYLTVVI